MSDTIIEIESKKITPEANTECQDWFIDDNSEIEPYYPQEKELAADPYRLYRFLTDIEDILQETPEDRQRLLAIAPLVRNLLNSSYWLHVEYNPPSPKLGWSVKMLYEEQDYPLTVQMVAWSPGTSSPIHNHATWGIVAVISGREKNQFWRRSPTPEFPDRLELVSEKILEPGDLICLMPDAIHSVESVGDEATISFNLYGVTDFSRRYEFDTQNHTAKHF
jgi:predicted metal-dependent enzyme (double-stranded beta helix superfamily)